MTINDRYNVIFIHVPKCAGCFIDEHIFPNTRNVKKKKIGFHTNAIKYQKSYPFAFNRYFKFAVVRNPYARFVSAFFYLKKGGMGNKHDIMCQNKIGNTTFEQFVKKFENDKGLQDLLHFKAMSSFVCNKEGQIVVDKIVQLESFSEEMVKLLKLFNIDKKIPVVNSSKHNPYEEYYKDKQLKDIIYKHYQKDFMMFGYDY